jgi:hypothetical protein
VTDIEMTNGTKHTVEKRPEEMEIIQWGDGGVRFMQATDDLLLAEVHIVSMEVQ